jgi:hypothetical protein
MNEGYVVDGGAEYYCDDPCLHQSMTAELYEELHADGEGDTYWTEWEDESEWEDA